VIVNAVVPPLLPSIEVVVGDVVVEVVEGEEGAVDRFIVDPFEQEGVVEVMVVVVTTDTP